MSHSTFPSRLSKMVAQKSRDDWRREHGTEPPSASEYSDLVIKQRSGWNEKDWAWFNYLVASSSVRQEERGLLYLTEDDSREEKNRSDAAYQRYVDTPGERTRYDGSLREKVCEVLDSDKNKIWLVRDLATLLGHPANHVGVVASFLRKDPKKKWNVK